jgi:Tol biopolymer transport system component
MTKLFWGLVLASAVAFTVAALGKSAASTSPAARTLVYAKPANPFGNERIWRAGSDGSHPVFVTAGKLPQLSPDGRWIAFVRTQDRPLRSKLLVVPTSGGQRRLLDQLEGAFFDAPVWASDSRNLVAVDDGGPVENGGLVLIDARSGRRTSLARSTDFTGVGSPSFSPDARRIVYVRDDGTGGDLYVYTISTRTTRRITHDHTSSDPSWGPSWIAYNRGGFNHAGDIWLIHGDGARVHRLTHTSAGIYPAAWSADGTRLLAANPAVHNGRLWAVALRRGRTRALTGWIGDLYAQGLSRDGNTVLAAIGCGGRVSPDGTIETLPFSGGTPKVIVTGPCRASWNR